MTAPALPDLLGTSPSDLLIDPISWADLTTARQRAERIRTDLVTYSRMRQDIADAYAQRDWAALGYDSWYAYLDGEFGQELQQLARSREERQLAVGDLRGQGLSTRQIASVAGVDAKTVRNDLAELPAAAPAGKVVGSDGKTYPAKRPAAATAGTPNDPAGPVPTADDPPAAATSRDSRPEDRPGPQLPADRDPQVFQTEPGEESPAAVATTGQPGPLRIAGSDDVEVFDHGVIHVGDRDLHLRAGRIEGDVPVAWLSVQHHGEETELLALNPLKVQLLIQKLTAIHGWLTGEQLPDNE